MSDEKFNFTGIPEDTVIDIIVPTHGHLELTIQCLDALYNNTKTKFHLVIVDDSTDLTPLYIRGFQKERDNITFIHSDEPFKTGNQFFNKALEKCENEYVATVMNSVRVEPDWEVAAVGILNQNPDIGTIGLKCIFDDHRIESAGIALIDFGTTYNSTTDIGRGQPAHRLCSIRECDAVQWAFALHRRKAIQGNIDNDIFYGFKGWDDLDNCYSIRQKGWKVFYCGLGVGYHKPRATRGSTTAEAIIQNKINAEKFYKRWNKWEEYKAHYKLPKDYEGLNLDDEMESTQDKMWKLMATVDATD